MHYVRPSTTKHRVVGVVGVHVVAAWPSHWETWRVMHISSISTSKLIMHIHIVDVAISWPPYQIILGQHAIRAKFVA